MGLAELRAFLHVVDEGSFAAAAAALDMSRTTLRRHVEALEAETGAQLLERSSKGVVLTAAGRRLVRGGRLMEQEFTALIRTIRETDERPEGELRLMLPAGVMPTALAFLFGLARSNWPGVRLHTSFTDEPQTVKISETDMAVWFGDAAPLGAWEVRTIAVTRQRLLASPAYLREHGTPRSIGELAGHTVMAWLGHGESEPSLFTRQGEKLPLVASAVTRNPHFLHECAYLGYGVAWVPDADLGTPPGQQPLVRLLDDLVGRDVPMQFGVPRSLMTLPKVRVFLENLETIRAHVYENIVDHMARR
ncbi:MAG: LysR family transcriptional regulator [Labilithrix sp.]